MESNEIQTPAQVLDALRSGYSRYLEGVAEARTASLGEAIGFFFRSQGNPRVNALMDAFGKTLEEWIDALAGLLPGCTPEEADEFAAQAVEQMLFYPRPDDQAIEFALLAFEGYAAPLIPFLASARRAEMAERYKKRTPPRRMLPNQKKLWKALNGR